MRKAPSIGVAVLAVWLAGFSLALGTPPTLSSASPEDVERQAFDVVVAGGTPAGIACAVRAAREGLRVLLVQHTRHLGGMLTNGLFQWDALYAGPRAPLFDEYAHEIEEHYRSTYGPASPQYKVAQLSQKHYPMSRFEPSVAEREFNRLVEAEKNLTVLLGHYPSAVERDGARLRSVTCRAYGGSREVRVAAATYVDATYEGDLMALARVPYRVGREGREEYGEPHAGQVFTNIESRPGPRDAVEGRLNLHPYAHRQGSIDPTSPGTADAAVQAYNYRFCLTDDPANRVLPERPENYRREDYVNFNRKGMSGGGLNRKGTFNSAILPGENHAYPEADWPARERIIQRHRDFALGLMYFLQNDDSVAPAARAKYREIGLPLDEYADHGHLPYEMYVREARRLAGRYVFKEQDNMLAPGLSRTPIFADSIAITDWAMDSHACTAERRPGFEFDGKLILTEESRPAQVPYRALLPQGVENLLVPVCLSATHVAWGSVRLEPVWMDLGEAAGWAAVLAAREQTTPAQLAPARLVRLLVEHGFLVSFFNDAGLQPKTSWAAAAQYFGTRGFFADYDVRADQPLTRSTAEVWLAAFAEEAAGTWDPLATARRVAAGSAGESALTPADFLALPAVASLPAAVRSRLQTEFSRPERTSLSRGDLCAALYAALQP